MRKIFISLAISFWGFLAFSQNVPNGQMAPLPAANINPVPAAYNNNIPINYTISWDVRMPSSDILQIVQPDQVKNVFQITEYTDGMGRVLQNVKKGITPSGKDVVSPRIYDNEGREVFNYLSYPSPSNDGKIKLNSFGEQAAYMQAQPQYAGEQIYYSKTIFDNSPLSNVEKTLAAGNSYAGNDRGSTMKYESNGINEVRYWTVDNTSGSLPLTGSFYDPAALYRGTVTDVNGKRVVSYKDKEGRIILKKVEIKNNGVAVITDYDGWLCTYYVYDDVSHLRYTITPRAVEWLLTYSWSPLTSTIIDALCFRYDYDDKGRVITTKSPGAEEVSTVYDAKDRAILFRDGNLLTAGKWQYTLYDNLNRVVQKGLWTNSQNRDAHQLLAENSTIYPLNSMGSYEILEYNYFDDYSSLNAGLPVAFDASQLNGSWLNTTSADQFPYPLPLSQSQQTLDLRIAVRTKVLNSSPAQYLYTVFFYDKYGNVIQSISSNISGGIDVITTQYGYGGKVLASHLQHSYISNGITQTYNVYSRQEYDDAGRVLRSFKRINNDPEKIQTNNTYNEQSQLIKVELGKSASNTPIETLDYSYGLTGNFKGLNEAFVNGSTSDRYFGEILSRDYGFTSSQYNGNISGVQWRSIGDGERRAFGFSYDPANRLLNSEFTQYSGGWNNTANVDYSMKMGDGVNPASAYDANGNILLMTQKALKLYQSDVVDNLVYQYENSNYSNRLYTVSDNASSGTAPNTPENALGDFKDNIPGSPSYDYLYDANGNTTVDNNKGIISITYNYLNKPEQIQISGKGSITYVYDAGGEKLKKIIQPLSGNPITYTYVGGFTYKNDVLQNFLTEEGRVRPLVPASGQPSFAYDYFIKDHLGNLRMILTDEVKKDFYPIATLESATVANEAIYYDRTNVGITTRPGAFGTSATNGSSVQLLQKNTNPIGVSKLLKVMVKDQINVNVDYYFPSQTVDNSGANGLNSVVTLLSTLLNSAGAPGMLAGHGTEIGQQLSSNALFNTLLQPQNASQPGSAPKAYLNIIFFDEQFRFVSQNSEIIGVSIAGSRQPLISSRIAPKNGYVYIYVSNESNNLVYFDNLQVSHFRGALLEEDHYNTFGAKMTALCSRALPGAYNSIGYQGKELDEEFDLDWSDFGARNYDAQIGRFLQQDPADQFSSGYIGMGNNWAIGTDPDGRFLNIIIGAIVGAVINVATNLDHIHSVGDFFGYAGVGAVSGALASVGQFAAAGAVAGLGNALMGGERDPGRLFQQTFMGAVSGAVGGIVGSKLNSVITTSLSRVVGSQATQVVSNIASSAILGGGMGAGFSAMNGQNAWQGFLSGLRSGAITGAISVAVPMAINKINEPKASIPSTEQTTSNTTEEPTNLNTTQERRLTPLRDEVELIKTEEPELPQNNLAPTKGNFRKNLIAKTGINPGNDAQAHHDIPQFLRERMAKYGINVDDPKYGRWWQTSTHNTNAYAFNQKWKAFLLEVPHPSVQQVHGFVDYLRIRYPKGITGYGH